MIVDTSTDKHKFNTSQELPKEPRVGYFKPTSSWTTAPTRKSHPHASPKVTSTPQVVPASNAAIDVSELENHVVDQSRGYGPDFSPNMLHRSAPLQATPMTKTKAVAPPGSKRRGLQADHDHIEEEVLATPRYNLRQTPSSLRSTVQSPRSSTRRSQATNRLQYNPGLASDFFDVVGESFKL